MSTTFIGWMGYGTGMAGSTLLEPADTAYLRHPISLGDLDSGIVFNSIGGTVGPATSNWGDLGFAGVFDAAQGGNMLFWIPLAQRFHVSVSGTYTTARHSLRFLFRELVGGSGTSQVWPAGTVVAELNDHRRVTTGVMLQFARGVFSAYSPVLGSSVTMANLPSVQPTAGSGQLWSNGGIIAVA